MKSNRQGVHLFMSALLSLTVIVIAFFLSHLRSSTIVPAIALIKADYQIESAIIMQLQEANNNPALPAQKLEKEIMPGVRLKLVGVAGKDGEWQFNGSITGNQLNRKFSAIANIAYPDQINFTQSTESE